MLRLSAAYLLVSNPIKIADFYTTHLGMTAHETPEGWRVGYPGQDADILLMPGGGTYRPARSDRYWKIGITLPNIDIAVEQLRNAGITIGEPQQFLDIGYLCHFSDPAGFQIELLQQDFYGNRPADAGNPDLPLGGGACIGQISLRSGDIVASSDHLERLGMRLLSAQPVPAFAFNLYFWAFTDETPPQSDLTSVANREWLWKRPYTTLEIQHVKDLSPTRNPGYAGIEIEGLSEAMTDEFGDKIRPYSA